MAFLVKRFGSYAKLAVAADVKRQTLILAASKRGSVSAASHCASQGRAGVPLEIVLSGAWPPAGACPTCGRSAEHDDRREP